MNLTKSRLNLIWMWRSCNPETMPVVFRLKTKASKPVEETNSRTSNLIV